MYKRISTIPDKCTSCRSCEIACSYHFNKIFQPDRSEIKIHFNAESGEIKISINEGCDQCEGEKEPLCVKYCATRAIFLE